MSVFIFGFFIFSHEFSRIGTYRSFLAPNFHESPLFFKNSAGGQPWQETAGGSECRYLLSLCSPSDFLHQALKHGPVFSPDT
jgi:hypothetical protein